MSKGTNKFSSSFIVLLVAFVIWVFWDYRSTGSIVFSSEQTARQAMAVIYHDRKPGLSLNIDSNGSGFSNSYYGGIPTYFDGEKWPRSRTDRPMTFLGQITTTEMDPQFSGKIGLVRVFVDFELLDRAPVESFTTVWVTPAKSMKNPKPWPDALLADLVSDFQEDGYYRLIHSKVSIKPRLVETLDSAALQEAYDRFKVDDPVNRWVAINAEVDRLRKEHPELVFPQDNGLLGGYPYWIQNAEPQRLPFYLQLVPPNGLMLGDGGHLYIFIDRDNPSIGHSFVLQMY